MGGARQEVGEEVDVRFWGPPGPLRGGIREPAVAGRFYPGRVERLAGDIDRYVDDARVALAARGAPAAPTRRASEAPDGTGAERHVVGVVAPHAGIVYSGPTAGFAYASIDPSAVRRVVLLGPAHYVPVSGIGLSSAGAWRTPLGDVELDHDVAAELAEQLTTVLPADDAHAPEHSLEVQVPFLQRVLTGGWRLVPLIVGADEPGEIAAAISVCVGLPGTLVVVSTDLSHYLDYESAIARDARTIHAIVHRRPDSIGTEDACGRYPLRGLLTAAAEKEWSVRLLDASNSGDTAGDRDRVVGYSAFAVLAASEPDPPVPGGSDQGRDTDTAGGGAGAGMGAGAGTDPAGPVGPGPGPGPEVGRIPPDSRAMLLALARSTISEALDDGRRPAFDDSQWATVKPVLTSPGAAFVTLRSEAGELLGCIGSLEPRQPLVADVADHAFDAAFRDPRFPPMTRDRAAGMVIDISVLGPTRSFPSTGYEDLVSRIPVGSGLVVTAGRHRATFLPAVWEQLPDARSFLAALWRKAGLAPGAWPRGTRVEVYDSEEFAEA